MTHAVAKRRAGGFRWPARLARNPDRKSRVQVALKEWLGDTAKGFAITLAIGLWPVASAPGLSALERDYPSNEEQRIDQTAQKLAEKAKTAFNGGEYAEAIRSYSQLSRLKPHDDRVLFNRGQARKKSGDTSGALDDLNDALALNPDLHVALVNRAHIYLQQGRETDAAADLARAEDLRPRDPTILFYSGSAYLRTGDLRRAIVYFTKALECNARNAPALAERGHAFLRQGQIEAAKTDFARALGIDPTSARARSGLETLSE